MIDFEEQDARHKRAQEEQANRERAAREAAQGSEPKPGGEEEPAKKNANKGKVVGNYVLGRDLGKGTFGEVMVGTHSLTGEKVAIKVLEKEKIIDVHDVERVAREIHILKIVRHPTIV
jgi:serine/threonine protein kinase